MVRVRVVVRAMATPCRVVSSPPVVRVTVLEIHFRLGLGLGNYVRRNTLKVSVKVRLVLGLVFGSGL